MRQTRRIPDIEAILARDYERHCGFPEGALSQGRVQHLPSEEKRAVWTPDGGVVACTETTLAVRIAAVIAGHQGKWSEIVFSALREALGPGLAEASSLDVLLYCSTASIALRNEWWDPVEMLEPGTEGLPQLHEAEHVFVIKDSRLVEPEPGSASQSSSSTSRLPPAMAWNRPSLLAEGIQFHAVEVGTRPDYRKRGLGKAVVSALLDHIASEGGVALWNYDVLNFPSLRLARSVGFVEYLWKFDWNVSEEEMKVRRAVIRATGGGGGE